MKHYNQYIILIISAVLLSGCMDYPIPVTETNKDNIIDIVPYYTSATVHYGREFITIDNVVLEYSVDSTFAEYEVSKMKTDTNYHYPAYIDSLTNLIAGTTYYVRFRVSNTYSSFVTDTHSFTTYAAELPGVLTVSVDSVTTVSAVLHGKLRYWGTDNMPTVGFYYATHFYVTEQDPFITVPVSGKKDQILDYAVKLTGLANNQNYYFRAYAKNEAGVTLGEEMSFRTLNLTLPVVSTVTATNISCNTVTFSAGVTYDGGLEVTDRGICYATTSNPTVSDTKIACGNGIGDFDCTVDNLNANTTYYVRAYAVNSLGITYGEELQIHTLMEGAMTGVFTVSATKKVRFSKGNLQYNASMGTHSCADGNSQPGTWRFAEDQTSVIGAENSQASQNYDGWIDLFGWATSGYNLQYPYKTSTNWDDYYHEADIAGSYYDWGIYNAISNGGDMPNYWRTLTKDEWYYIFYYRDDSRSKYGMAKVDGKTGFVLLPDDFILPTGLTFTKLHSQTDIGPVNVYTKSQWDSMESAGAVFLPAAGYREGVELTKVGETGYYWSTTFYTQYQTVGAVTSTSYFAYGILFFDGWWSYNSQAYPFNMAFAVRLVQDAE